MVKEASAKINRVGPRHTIYLQKDLVEDTAFPFMLNEHLSVRVERERLIIERVRGRTPTGSDFAIENPETPAVLPILDSLGFSPVLSKAEKIYEMLKEIHEAETLELRVRLIPPREHAILLYHDRDFLSRIIAEFFDPTATGDAPRALLSEKHAGFDSVNNVLYREILDKGKERVSETILDWMSDIHASNKSSAATRIAIKDQSWFVENGFAREMLEYEQKIATRLKGDVTILCGYRVSVLDEPEMKRLIDLHTYVILDSPLRVYRKPDR